MSATPLSPELLAQIARLDAMGDDDSTIDLSDIPEISDAQWARRMRPGQMADTLLVEAETVLWFRKTAGGKYRAEMNAVLRRAMLRRRRRAERLAASG